MYVESIVAARRSSTERFLLIIIIIMEGNDQLSGWDYITGYSPID